MCPLGPREGGRVGRGRRAGGWRWFCDGPTVSLFLRATGRSVVGVEGGAGVRNGIIGGGLKGATDGELEESIEAGF